MDENEIEERVMEMISEWNEFVRWLKVQELIKKKHNIELLR